MVCIALVAFASLALTLALMLAWTLVATAVYWEARRRGFPDLIQVDAPQRGATAIRRAGALAGSALKVMCAGIQAVVFAQFSGQSVLPSASARGRVLRLAVLFAGLTLFGVSMSEHLLRRAGFEGARLLHLSMAAAFLNVPYHVLLSAAVTNAAWQAVTMLGA